MPVRHLLLIASLLFAAVAPQPSLAVQKRVEVPPAATMPTPEQAAAMLNGFAATGLNMAARDTAVRPGDDFNLYANGSWIGMIRGVPGGDDLSYSIQAQLSEDVEAQLRAIVEAPSGDAAAAQINNLYRSFMDEARLQQLGLQPRLSPPSFYREWLQYAARLRHHPRSRQSGPLHRRPWQRRFADAGARLLLARRS